MARELASSAPEKTRIETARLALEREDGAACAHALESLTSDDAPPLASLLNAACQQQRGQWLYARGLLANLLKRNDAAGAAWQPLAQRWSARLAATSPKVVVRLDGPYLPDWVSVSIHSIPIDKLGRTFTTDPGKHSMRARRDNPLADAHADFVTHIGCTTTVTARLERAVYSCMTPEESECLRRSSQSSRRACQERLERCRQRCEQRYR